MFWSLFAYAILPFGHLMTPAASPPADCCKCDPISEEVVCQERMRSIMESQIGIFEQPPENFDHTIQVSACVVRVNDRILALQRGGHKYDPRKWEVPGGKFLKGETLNVCASRELFEETGIEQDSFQEIGVLYVRRMEGDFTLRVILTEFLEFPNVEISKEHCSYRWVTADEMRNLDLIKGEEHLIDMYLKSVVSD